jgi:hypothetical protein
MVQVSGTTYRIEARPSAHAVVRILDDRCVGFFTSSPKLAVLRSELAGEELSEVARTALRAGLLPWSPRASAGARRNIRAPQRDTGIVSRLLLLVWPAL